MEINDLVSYFGFGTTFDDFGTTFNDLVSNL